MIRNVALGNAAWFFLSRVLLCLITYVQTDRSSRYRNGLESQLLLIVQ